MRWGNGGEDDVSGSGAYTHMTLLVGDHRGHAQPVPAVVARVDGGLLLQAAHGSRPAQPVLDRAHRDDRLRRAARSRPASGSASGTRPSRPRASTATSSAATTSSSRSWITASASSAASWATSPARERGRPAAGRHQRPALHPRRRLRRPRDPALRAVGIDARRPEPVQVRLAGVLPEDSRADARAVPRSSGRVRQHPADRRALRRDLHQARPDAPLPGSRGRDGGELVREGGRARARRAVRGGTQREAPRRRPRTRSRSSRRWASRATSSSSPTSSAGRRRRASGSVPVEARPPARSRRTPSASRSSTRCTTGSSSSASSTPSASRCRMSTSTSTTVAAAR